MSIQNIFNQLKIALNEREEKLLLEVENQYKEIFDNEDILEEIENATKSDGEKDMEPDDGDDTDPLLMDAIETVVEVGTASTSFIQRKFKVGYARAGRIIDQMEQRGIISGFEGSKPRRVLITMERLNELKMAPGEVEEGTE